MYLVIIFILNQLFDNGEDGLRWATSVVNAGTLHKSGALTRACRHANQFTLIGSGELAHSADPKRTNNVRGALFEKNHIEQSLQVMSDTVNNTAAATVDGVAATEGVEQPHAAVSSDQTDVMIAREQTCACCASCAQELALLNERNDALTQSTK